MANAEKNFSTKENKQRRVARQERLAARPGDAVSDNCRKSRAKRARRKEWLKADRKTRGISPTEKGERQFGEKAKGYHLHQREHGLATALTPKEFHELERKQRKLDKGKVKIEIEMEA